jgi:chromosomal replication initiation ATPase DnaA
VYYLARKQGISLSVIGRIMGRDHTTVAHGVKAEEARRLGES